MLETVVNRLYEGLFLVDSGQATADWDGVNAMITKVLDRSGAEIVSLNKWDDRKLAYEVVGKSRGTYLLCYFNCDTSKITNIERDVQLSEQIIRVMILRADVMSPEDIAKATPAAVMVRKIKEDAEAAAKRAEAKAAAEAEKVEAEKKAEAEETETVESETTAEESTTTDEDEVTEKEESI